MKTPDRRALQRIELKNLLSFGPDSPALELENLNLLIGANGSGKSNLIEAISLLRATPVSANATKSSLRGVVTRGGGVDEWIFKGENSKADILVDAMTDRPEAVVVCGKLEGQIHMRRLTKDELAPWLQKYRLGELWSRGHMGANRW